MDAMNTTISPRAELWQCLAQGFLPPSGEILSQAMHAYLHDDLEDIASVLGLNMQGALGELRAAMSQAEVTELLPTYSSLFLVPPIPAKLNMGFYLDGTLLGPNTQRLMEILHRHGVEQSPEMHETPDHLAMALEFLALLFHQSDGLEVGKLGEMLEDMNMLRAMLARVLPEMLERTIQAEQERFLPGVYSALLRLSIALLRDEQCIFFSDVIEDVAEPEKRYFSKRATVPDLVSCKQCGKAIATARELRVIIDRLQQCGLPAGHLEWCPDCRDSAQGWKPGKTDFNLPGFR